jgi:hypothetical protein
VRPSGGEWNLRTIWISEGPECHMPYEKIFNRCIDVDFMYDERTKLEPTSLSADD